MRLARMLAVSSVMVFAFTSLALADSSGRIYGKLTTVDGDVFEGLIRWDKNEASWVDILHGNKELPRKRRRRYRDRERSIKIFGISISRYRERDESGMAQSGVSFGHIKTLEVTDDNAVLLTLKSGHTVELESGSTDIGRSIRGLIIEDRNEGEVEFDWSDVASIDFMQGDSNLKSTFGKRLYGTLTTRRDDKYTGWVCWDVDELVTQDVLDGKQKHRKRKIKFGKIKSIERNNSKSARVTLKDDDEIVLRGTNDVDDSNRGIVIYVEGFGQVKVDWDEFDRLEFESPPSPVKYDEFGGGHRLEGIVYTEDGDQYGGWIRWDDDEEYTWEFLDGNFRGVEYDIEFGNIKEIKRKGYSSSIVTLWDGHSFRLKGTNDVDEDNKGIFIELDNGEEIEIDWGEFNRIEFTRK